MVNDGHLPAYIFDAAFLGIALLSALVGVIRGFTREFCGVMGWLGAIIVTLLAFSPVLSIANRYIDKAWMTYAVTTVVVFLPSYIVLRLTSSWLSRKIKESFLSSLDRTLGGIWGLLRGWFLASVVFIITAILAPSILTPLSSARLFGVVQSSSAWLLSQLPKQLDGKPMIPPSPFMGPFMMPPPLPLSKGQRSSPEAPTPAERRRMAQRLSSMKVAPPLSHKPH